MDHPTVPRTRPGHQILSICTGIESTYNWNYTGAPENRLEVIFMQQLVKDHQRRQTNWTQFSPSMTPCNRRFHASIASWLIYVPVELTPSIFQNTGSEVMIAWCANCQVTSGWPGDPLTTVHFRGSSISCHSNFRPFGGRVLHNGHVLHNRRSRQFIPKLPPPSNFTSRCTLSSSTLHLL
jgi:hypothetical protein